MIVLVGFLLGVVAISGSRASEGRTMPFRWILLMSVLVTVSFLSLRVVE